MFTECELIIVLGSFSEVKYRILTKTDCSFAYKHAAIVFYNKLSCKLALALKQRSETLQKKSFCTFVLLLLTSFIAIIIV